MLINYLDILYLTLPAFVANASPVIVNRLKIWQSLAVPIDGGKTWNGKLILGKNKTWRGIVIAVMAASLTALMLYSLDLPLFKSASLLNSPLYSLGYGALVGLLCMLGDITGSFIKRYIGVQSGHPFIPLDQIDYMIAYVLGTFFILSWDAGEVIFLLTFAFFINLVTNLVAYKLGIKSTYW
jgi:CDP-2,3-bis-(O-geranylgeranyl)-sn-glycerol synthase